MVAELHSLEKIVQKPSTTPANTGILQRKCEKCRDKEKILQRSSIGSTPEAVSPIVHEVLRSPGQPLDIVIRAFTEPCFSHDFSHVPVHSKLPTGIQAKLTVNAHGDIYEQEADRIAHQVMAQPANTNVSGTLPSIQRFSGQMNGRVNAAPASVDQALASPGRPLEPTLLRDMEQRFGHDFSRVRVHTGTAAEQSARDVNAHAYTIGNNVVFGAGQFAPDTSHGRRLIVHELTHTLQQSAGSMTLQRFVPCTRPRMSLEECPQREPGEYAQSRRDPMIVEFITSPEVGYLIANFDIGESKLKASAKSHLNWPKLISTISQAGSQWELLGLSDCHGSEQQNKMVRKQRADAVRAALPPTAAVHIVRSEDASLGDCITYNDNRIARAWNRAVLIRATQRELNLKPTEISGKRPVPKPVDQPTADCNDAQEKAVDQSQPIAVEMVRKALFVLRDKNNPTVKQLLRKYFNDDGPTTFSHVHDGLLNTLKGLKSGIKLECETKGSLTYNHFCPDTSARVTTAYVRHWIVGLRIHLCEAAFRGNDLDLAATLVHECSHLFDHTDDKRYCWKDCSKLDPETAYDNADSYAGFSHDAFVKL
jgi:hypothetical protein